MPGITNIKPFFLCTVLVMLCSVGVLLFNAWKIGEHPHESKHPKSRMELIAHNASFNQHLVDSAISLLQSGDVVLRMGSDPDSYLLSIMNTKDKTFSHCGIVMVENGYPYIYHCVGGEDNPDERMRRDSACIFFSPVHNLSIGIVRYTCDKAHLSALKQIVNRFYELRPKFDLDFDLATDDKLYCSEFVYKAMNKAMNDDHFIKTTTAFGHTYVAIDDLSLNPHASLVWKVAYK